MIFGPILPFELLTMHGQAVLYRPGDWDRMRGGGGERSVAGITNGACVGSTKMAGSGPAAGRMVVEARINHRKLDRAWTFVSRIRDLGTFFVFDQLWSSLDALT